jgi:hypothetical protein
MPSTVKAARPSNNGSGTPSCLLVSAYWLYSRAPRAEVLRGCPFHNAAVESAGVLTRTDTIVRNHKLNFTSRLTDVAHELGAADPHLLGQQLAVLFEGAAAMATSLNDTAPVVHARAAAVALIDAAVTQDTRR